MYNVEENNEISFFISTINYCVHFKFMLNRCHNGSIC